jgi:hypothetical protein
LRASGESATIRAAALSTTRGIVVALAQLAEHRIVAPEVTGSTPVGHPTFHSLGFGRFGASGLLGMPAQ